MYILYFVEYMADIVLIIFMCHHESMLILMCPRVNTLSDENEGLLSRGGLVAPAHIAPMQRYGVSAKSVRGH